MTWGGSFFRTLFIELFNLPSYNVQLTPTCVTTTSFVRLVAIASNEQLMECLQVQKGIFPVEVTRPVRLVS